MTVYKTLQLTRVDNTERTFDVECNWRESGWVWLARIVYDETSGNLATTRGGLNLGEISAIRLRFTSAHGRVFTVQL